MPDMNCMEFESRLQELAEQRQSLEDLSNNGLKNGDSAWDELRAQAGACPHCRQLWNEFALLDRVMPGIRTLVPHVDLVDAVIDSWRQESPGKLSPTTAKSASGRHAAARNWIPLLVVAAASILISFPLLFPDSASEDLPTTFEVAVSPEDDIPDSPATNETAATETSSGEVDWHILAEDAGSAYWALASERRNARPDWGSI